MIKDIKREQSWSSCVEYVAQRLRLLGEEEARLCALRFEENLGLDQNKLLTAAREQLQVKGISR